MFSLFSLSVPAADIAVSALFKKCQKNGVLKYLWWSMRLAITGYFSGMPLKLKERNISNKCNRL